MSYYRMHRGWMDGKFFANQKRDPFDRRSAWMWLIEHAAFDGPKRGQLSHSIRYLADVWGWSSTKVFRCLRSCVSEGMITCSTETGQVTITICNYDKYQYRIKITETPQTVTVKRDRNDTETESKKEEGIKEDSEAIASDAGASSPDPAELIWIKGLAIVGEKRRSLLGKLRKECGEVVLLEAIIETEHECPIEPLEYLIGCCRRRKSNGRQSPGEKLYEGAFRAAERWERGEADRESGGSAVVPLLDRRRSSGNA